MCTGARYLLDVATFGDHAVRFELPRVGGWTDADWSGLAAGATGTLLPDAGTG